MSYQVLYRAWRPDTFSEICGQDAVTATLKRQVMSGRIAHAYLFCGTRGTGKTTAAKVLSKAINCLNPVDGDPCGECEVCRALREETCMDVVEIDAASNNGVDEIRDLREKVKFPPSLTQYRVYIIDEVHMLSTGAFNALLKTLEEPPKHAVFILATTEPHKLPATVLSRCQRFDFHRIAMDVIIGRLKVVLKGIGRNAEEEALAEIARAAEGGMRDALSLLDCCLSYTDGDVTHALALDVLGTAGRGFVFEFADALIGYDTAAALKKIDDMMRKGSDPTVFAREVTAHFRALLLAMAVGDVTELLEVTPEDSARYVEQSKRVPEARATRLMELYMRVEPDMKWATRPRTVLELATVRACHPEEEQDAALSERLDKLEKRLETGDFVAKKPAKSAAAHAEAAPTTEPAPKKTAPQTKRDAPPQPYLDALEKVREETPSVRRFLDDMSFLRLEEGAVVADFPKSKNMSMRMIERKKDLLDAALTESFGEPMTLRIVEEGAGKSAAPSVSATAKRVIEESYDVFGRENIDIRE